MKEFYKTVLLPIKVCTGDYCWDGHKHVCGHFDNLAGSGRCILKIADLKMDKERHYPKPKKCSELEEKKQKAGDYVTTEPFGPFFEIEGVNRLQLEEDKK